MKTPGKNWKLTLCVTMLVLFTDANVFGEEFDGLYMNLGNLSRLSDAKSRSISPENFTGEKGKGGAAGIDKGSAAHAGRNLGLGWKVNPYVHIELNQTFVMGEIKGSGAIQ
jgi:hypothetical protein